MLLCDLSGCDAPAVALVHFNNKATPVPYCERHGFNRFGHPVFGRMNSGQWISPVHHIESIPQQGDTHE